MLIDTNRIKQLNISVNQYLLCDLIAQSESRNGWCSLEKKALAKKLDLSEIYVFKMIKSLLTKNLLEKHPSLSRRQLLRVSQKWKEMVKK